MKIVMWAAIVILVAVLAVTFYWLTESDVWIDPAKVIIVTQVKGISTAIEVPTQPYSKALSRFKLKTLIRSSRGRLLNQTAEIEYSPGMKYMFVTPADLDLGRYEASVMVTYRVNLLKTSEQEFPLAIIYVESMYPVSVEHSGAK